MKLQIIGREFQSKNNIYPDFAVCYCWNEKKVFDHVFVYIVGIKAI